MYYNLLEFNKFLLPTYLESIFQKTHSEQKWEKHFTKQDKNQFSSKTRSNVIQSLSSNNKVDLVDLDSPFPPFPLPAANPSSRFFLPSTSSRRQATGDRSGDRGWCCRRLATDPRSKTSFTFSLVCIQTKRTIQFNTTNNFTFKHWFIAIGIG